MGGNTQARLECAQRKFQIRSKDAVAFTSVKSSLPTLLALVALDQPEDRAAAALVRLSPCYFRNPPNSVVGAWASSLPWKKQSPRVMRAVSPHLTLRLLASPCEFETAGSRRWCRRFCPRRFGQNNNLVPLALPAPAGRCCQPGPAAPMHQPKSPSQFFFSSLQAVWRLVYCLIHGPVPSTVSPDALTVSRYFKMPSLIATASCSR